MRNRILVLGFTMTLMLLGVAPVEAALCSGGGALPPNENWSDADIGGVVATGCASYDNATGTYRVDGAGPGTFITTTDGIHYLYRSITGNFTFVAKMLDVGGGGAPYAGLMIRASTAANSRNIETNESVLDGNGKTNFGTRRRFYNGDLNGAEFGIGDLNGDYVSDVTLPYFHKVVRYGDQISVYGSANGTAWTLVGGFTLDRVATTVLVGMFVTSQDPNVLATAHFSQVSITSPSLPYETSWFGNSFAGGSKWIQQDMTTMYVLPGNTVDPVTGQTQIGKIYANSIWDEAGAEAGIYDSTGSMERRLEATHGWNRLGGYAITASASYVYMAIEQDGGIGQPGFPPSGENWYAIRRYFPNGFPAPFAGGVGYDGSMLVVNKTTQPPADHVRGLALSAANNELYASDAANGKVRVYNLTTMASVPSRDFSVARPRALAAKGLALWVIQAATTQGGNDAKILKYSISDWNLLKTITGVHTPTAIAIALDGKVWVADNGPDQNIKIFNPNSGNLTGTFGDQFGILAGSTPGEVQPKKFNGPVGLGFDNNDNLYVAADADGGTTLRKFDSSQARNLVWERVGLEFITATGADPATDGADLFTPRNHYVMDYTKPAGQQWTQRGYLIDRFNYPQDLRLQGAIVPPPVGAFIRRIEGKRLMYVVTQQSNYLGIYRFPTGSEIAVPCSVMAASNLDRAWPPTEPDPGVMGRWIWRDLNNNKLMDANEYEADGPGQGIWGWYVDSAGDVWSASFASNPSGAPTIRRFMQQGLDAAGCPIYHSGNSESFAQPPVFTSLGRLVYVPGNDTLYLSGYTAQNPEAASFGYCSNSGAVCTTDAQCTTPAPAGICHLEIDFGNVGREVRRYDNWHLCATSSSNTCNSAWAITDLPYSRPFNIAKGLDVAGGRVVVGISQNAGIRIYRAATGLLETTRDPGPEVAGTSGLLDSTLPMGVFERSNGETLIITEEGAQAKQLFYRVPPPQCGPCVVDYCTGADIGCHFTSTCGEGGCCNYQCGVEMPGCTALQCPPNPPEVVCGGCP